MIQQFFTLPDGRVLAWRETGSGPPLVLLHGWSISGLAFAELAELLAAKYRVLMPDLPGHGDSSPAPENCLAALADDLQLWLVTLASQPVLLGGWSLGGMLAMELAGRAAIPLAGLVLISTTPRFTRAEDWSYGLPVTQVRALQRNLARRFEATLSDFFQLTFADEAITPERMREIRRFAVFGGKLPDPVAAAELLAFLAVQDQRVSAAELDLPTLVIHGQLDAITPVGAAQALADLLPQARLELLEDAGHAPFWSRPESVVKSLEECLQWAR